MKMIMKILDREENVMFLEREVVNGTVEILKTATAVGVVADRLESIGYELLNAEIVKENMMAKFNVNKPDEMKMHFLEEYAELCRKYQMTVGAPITELGKPKIMFDPRSTQDQRREVVEKHLTGIIERMKGEKK